MADDILRFPYPDSEERLNRYEYYQKLFYGEHFNAFAIKIDDPKYNRVYQQLRYITINFAGLISKVMADFLFTEPPVFKTDTGDQDFLDALIEQNGLNVQNYESALSNSYLGDAVYKIRLGKLNSTDEKSTVIIEDIPPTIYFPEINPFNVRQKPEIEELAWVFKYNNKEYLRKEIHTPGLIKYEVYTLENQKIGAKIDPKEVGLDLPEEEQTGIDRNLIVHIPNWKTGSRYFGISDYFDVESIFYAINNRMTLVDNILDKHSDPILTVPEGVLDEHGNVHRDRLGMIEIPDGTGTNGGKPEYIVWNASLENAFKEVERLTEFMFMVTETSPDILGMGKGVSDSGRALKLKLLRTIAKASRKRIYYDRGLKEALYIAQLMAQAHGVEVNGVKLRGLPEIPDIQWKDGLPIDESEQVKVEIDRIDAGLTSRRDAIMRIDGVDEEVAEIKVKEIDEEMAIDVPEPRLTTDFEVKA